MGILAALKLPPSRALAAAGKARAAKAARKPEAAKEQEEHVPVAPPALPATSATAAAAPALADAAEEVPVAPPLPRSGADAAGTDVDAATTSTEVGFGDGSISIKQKGDTYSIVAKYEHKIPGPASNFSVYGVPCYVKTDLKLGIEGGGELTLDNPKVAINVKGAGVLELGIGGTSPVVTAGPYGAAELSAGREIEISRKGAKDFAVEPFRFDVRGNGKVGIKFEIDKSWTMNKDAELVDWHILIVHVEGWSNAGWGKVWAEPGKDLQRLIAAIQQAGPAIADAVEKYAPDKVKKAAEDGAKWVAESDDAKKIADTTEVVLDKIEEETGVDIGGGAEKVVQVLVDPGGETADEATRRVENEARIANATNEEFHAMMDAAGLNGELRSRTEADKAEYNAIVDVWAAETNSLVKGGSAPGAWKPMIVALANKRRAEKKAREAAAAAKKKADADAAAVAAAADLARRVKAAEDAMNAALTAANMAGNPLEHDTRNQPESKARKTWQAGMNQYWSPGSAARLAALKLQGEQRILKCNEAAALLAKARVVFQQGLAQRG